MFKSCSIYMSVSLCLSSFTVFYVYAINLKENFMSTRHWGIYESVSLRLSRCTNSTNMCPNLVIYMSSFNYVRRVVQNSKVCPSHVVRMSLYCIVCLINKLMLCCYIERNTVSWWRFWTQRKMTFISTINVLINNYKTSYYQWAKRTNSLLAVI